MRGAFVTASGPAPIYLFFLLVWSIQIRIVKSVRKGVWRNAIHFVDTLVSTNTYRCVFTGGVSHA